MLSPQMALRDDGLKGFRIPAGSMNLISPYVMRRHPDFWRRPNVFDPDRFAAAVPAAFLPFRYGPWGYIGGQFGLLEARLVLTMAAQRYQWTLLPGHPVEPEPQVSLRRRHGLPLIVQPRA